MTSASDAGPVTSAGPALPRRTEPRPALPPRRVAQEVPMNAVQNLLRRLD
jgi:hypothetical protein